MWEGRRVEIHTLEPTRLPNILDPVWVALCCPKVNLPISLAKPKLGIFGRDGIVKVSGGEVGLLAPRCWIKPAVIE